MAIDAKMSFITQLSSGLSDTLTVEQMERMKMTAMDILEHFRVDELMISDDGDDDMLDCFIGAMRVQNRSEKTIARYQYVIGKFMSVTGVPTRRITIYHIRKYIEKEKMRGIKDSTLEGTRQVMSAYFGWLWREGLIEKNPMGNMGAIKVAKVQRKTFSETDIEKLVRESKTIRDTAIIHFLSSTGCRISEMTSLDRNSVDLERLECVVHGKGDKERTVFLSPVAGLTLSEYLNSRTDDEPALFIGIRKERMQPGGVRFMLKQLAKAAGVDHVHPHKFRRTRATELCRHGMPIQTVCRLLGHEKIDTTMRYVNVEKDDVKSELRRYA